MTPDDQQSVITWIVTIIIASVVTFAGVWSRRRDLNIETDSQRGRTGGNAQMMEQHLNRLNEIGRDLENAVSVLQDIRRALEGTANRQEKMVGELEAISRTMVRVENAQGAIALAITSMKHFDEVHVSIAAQIRDEIKNMRENRYPPHRKG
ncbi:hypothetical protein [Chelativorans sp.]|uniref:hypothetical protein n=1 Tax=Chelativorans sp. TaxID=2203393 RepID=UPI002812048E|nr:hypothetical protein [Chelativorans sp.]